MKYFCVLTTVPKISKARSLAGLLISKRLAACVQILPGLESHYRWRGKKETAKEILLLIKTRASAYKKLEKAILQNHPYEVPEIVAFPITKGSKTYLDWIDAEVKK
ncbi:MAG TPA: divalent-cation tolerance protein CutA [Candidatus Omnitrophota bacterium]|nr:divalent-cation tolerance protein CutA [Candidatus Omnitrophota bacterium]HRY85091.1 divalent-cation tolerance protein CutA [Candidatus Omnitrophota bacterium]